MIPIISVSLRLFIKSVQTAKVFLFSEKTALCRKAAFAAKIPATVFLIFISLSLSAQRKSDIGLFAGTSYYNGDINTSRQLYAPGLAIGPIYRYNFELRNALRLSAIYHQLQGSDRDFNDPFQTMRNASFNDTFIDLSANYEFNFLPYKSTDRKYNHSLYLSGGLGYNFIISTNTTAKSHLNIPFGIGYKINAGKKLSLGGEMIVHKTFSDKIDGVENFALEGSKHLFGNNDWYTFAGIFMTYKIFNFREDCPAYK